MQLVDFDQLLTEIDNEMAIEGIPVHLRSLRALERLSIRLNSDIPFNSSISESLNKWFLSKYGNRLKMPFQLGKMVILINHAPYLIDLPLIYGKIQINPFDYVKDMTPHLLNTLSEGEKAEIERLFKFGYKAYQEIQIFSNQITADIDTAIDQLMNIHPQPGLSKWASLQTSEKVLKELMKKHGLNIPKIHDLKKLEKECCALGMSTIPEAIISKIQCDPGIRYSEAHVSILEAVEAHHACLMLCQHVAFAYN